MASERTIRIKIAADQDVDKATRAAESAVARLAENTQKAGAKTENSGLEKSFRGIVSMGSKMATQAFKLAGALGTVGSAMGAVTAVAAGLATASGAALALPAGALAYAAILGTIKLGADGITKAFEGTAKSLDPLKKKISDTFEKGFKPVVTDINNILPKLAPGLNGIAVQLSAMAQQASKTVALPDNIKVLNGVLGGTRGMLDNLKSAIAPLVQAFIDIVSVGVPGLGKIGSGAGAAAEKFAAFIRTAKESGQLKQWMDNGINALKQFGAMVKDIWGIVSGVFKGISQGAGGVGGALAPVLDRLNAFINSTQGQAVLGAIGMALAAVGNALSTVLGPALMAVAPLIPPLLGLFAQATTAIADGLLPVINFLAPGLAAIATWIQQNTSWLGPLAIAIGVVTAASWLLNAALAANPIVLVIGLIVLLVAAFVSLWQKSEGFRNFFIGVWEAIKGAVGNSIQWIRDRWNDLVSAFEGTVQFFARIGTNIGNAISNGVKSGINWIIGVINGFIGGVNFVIDGLNNVPGVNIGHIPSIPKLAKGGIVDAAGLAIVGERGREMVSLPRGAQVHSNASTEAALGGGGPMMVQVFIGDRELTDIVDVRMKRASDQNYRRLSSGAGRGNR